MKIPVFNIFLPLALFMSGQPAWPADQSGTAPSISVILSADMPPYREALAGIEEVSGGRVAVTVLPGKPVITQETRAIIALGIKAAQLSYPPDKPLVIALAPGLPRESLADRSRPTVMVPMTPRAGKVVSALKRLQPELKRFTVLWTTDSADFSVSEMVSAAAELGLECDPVRIGSTDEIPGALRELTGRTGAIWLPLDPALLTSDNFGILKEYSRGNALPLYVSTEKLVRSGAPAGFSVSFAGMGRTAGLAANGLAAGRNAELFQYPEKIEIFIDPDALGSIDRRIVENAMKEGAQVSIEKQH